MSDETHYESRDRRMTLGNLLATLTLGLGMVGWAMQMNERLARVETQLQSVDRSQSDISDRQDRTEMRIETALSDIRRELVRINDKLDDKVDRDR